jgi:hypothetical protein
MTSENSDRIRFPLLMHPYATDTKIVAILTAEAQLKDIVQNLYNLIVQSYDHRGTQTQEAMKREMCVFHSRSENRS